MKPSGHYTILVADRSSGVVRRATVPIRPIAITVCVVLATPILIGMGSAWRAQSNVADLRASHKTLEIENENYRQATEALAGQIASLQLAIAELSTRSVLDANLARAMYRLPAIVKTRAMGGAAPVVESAGTGSEQVPSYARTLSALASPDDTFNLAKQSSIVQVFEQRAEQPKDRQLAARTMAFGLLRTLLENLDNRLTVVARAVDRRNALADATPSLWPAYGWLSSTMGPRKDPFTGAPEYHSGLDIASDRGDEVYATAAGTVRHVGRQGAYGNLIMIDHGFGLETRYGHLLKYLVTPGTKVQRGDVIAQIGATGRATGYHLHYEVVANGRVINPLALLTQKPLDR